MKTLARRIGKLENQFRSADMPRRHSRLQVILLGAKLCLADAKCTRTLCSDGSVMELVEFQKHEEGPDELTGEELDRGLKPSPSSDQRGARTMPTQLSGTALSGYRYSLGIHSDRIGNSLGPYREFTRTVSGPPRPNRETV
jgi:hypothetical protein